MLASIAICLAHIPWVSPVLLDITAKEGQTSARAAHALLATIAQLHGTALKMLTHSREKCVPLLFFALVMMLSLRHVQLPKACTAVEALRMVRVPPVL